MQTIKISFYLFSCRAKILINPVHIFLARDWPQINNIVWITFYFVQFLFGCSKLIWFRTDFFLNCSLSSYIFIYSTHKINQGKILTSFLTIFSLLKCKLYDNFCVRIICWYTVHSLSNKLIGKAGYIYGLFLCVNYSKEIFLIKPLANNFLWKGGWLGGKGSLSQFSLDIKFEINFNGQTFGF